MIEYRSCRHSVSKNVKNQQGKIKYGENITILMIVVEFQNVRRLGKIRRTFVLYSMLHMAHLIN